MEKTFKHSSTKITKVERGIKTDILSLSFVSFVSFVVSRIRIQGQARFCTFTISTMSRWPLLRYSRLPARG
jgi:hypothetical protein